MRRHALLFLLTLLTTFLAGVMLLATEADIYAPALTAPADTLSYVFYVPAHYLLMLAGTVFGASASLLTESLTFALLLLAILAAHEAGHYFACRHYGVEASLPYFIPAPPPFPTGTLGAFIKIRAQMPHRRALFDIAIAGPLAGFIVIVPIAIIALLTAVPALPLAPGESALYFNDPALLKLLSFPLGVRLDLIAPNSYYFAAWFGLFITSLNLIPVGQLDGGHAVYALFGAQAHRRLGFIAFVIVCLLAPLGYWLHNFPSNLLYAVLLFVMLRMRHPQVMAEDDKLGRTRILLALLTLLILALSFQPFPFTITYTH